MRWLDWVLVVVALGAITFVLTLPQCGYVHVPIGDSPAMRPCLPTPEPGFAMAGLIIAVAATAYFAVRVVRRASRRRIG